MRFAVAVDLADDKPERVVDAAIPWVVNDGGTLDILHVEGTRFATDWVSDPSIRKVVEAEAQAHRRTELARLGKLLDRVPAANRGAPRLLQGDPVSALVAAGSGYDALCVATHGRGGLAHFWLGSTAEQVVRRATCVVIVLRMSPI